MVTKDRLHISELMPGKKSFEKCVFFSVKLTKKVGIYEADFKNPLFYTFDEIYYKMSMVQGNLQN